MTPTLTIDKPVTLVLDPAHLGIVLDSLAERPFKVAQPVIESIVGQIRSSQIPPTSAEGAKEGAAPG